MDLGNNAVSYSKKSPEPLVSVLVPAYSHEKYVVECLESIKNLNYGRLELLLSDDCSRDATFTLAQQWAERNADRFERTLIVKQDNNTGIVRNLQYLFNNAQGAYLVYIASDDVFLECAIADRVKLLEATPDIDAVFGNAQFISSSGVVLKEEFIPRRVVRQLSSNKLLLPSLLINWCVPGPVMMLRRDAVLEGGSLGLLPQDLEGEDRYTYIRLAVQKRLMFINMVVAKWRCVPGSASNPKGARGRCTFTKKYRLASDKKMRSALTGFDRLVIETEIAALENDLNEKNTKKYFAKKVFFRLAMIQLRTILDIRTALRHCLLAVRSASLDSRG